MDYQTFSELWDAMGDWVYDSKKLFELGMDTSRHDRRLYDMVIRLMRLHFSEPQVDFIVWSIFDDKRELPLEDGSVTIDTPELCWEYLNKLKTDKDEIPS